MCGINGLWNLNGEPVDPRMFDRFTDALAHRGPDGRGVYIDSQTPVALGQRRRSLTPPMEVVNRCPMPEAGIGWFSTENCTTSSNYAQN